MAESEGKIAPLPERISAASIATLRRFNFILNNLHMTLMMVSPMTIIMMVSMLSMLPSQRLNGFVTAGAAVVFLFSFVGMRTKDGIGSAEFLR